MVTRSKPGKHYSNTFIAKFGAILISLLIAIATGAKSVNASSSPRQQSLPFFVSVDWSPDGKFIALGGLGIVRLYTATMQKVLDFPRTPNEFFTVTWSPDSSKLAGNAKSDVYVWDVSGKLLQLLHPKVGLRYVTWSPDSQTIGMGGYGGTVLYNLDTATSIHLGDDKDDVIVIAWHPQKQEIAIAVGGQYIQIWDTKSAQLTGIFDVIKEINTLSWSPDGSQVVTNAAKPISLTYGVQLWSSTGHQLRSFMGHSDWTLIVRWSPDGKKIASSSADDSVIVWDVSTGTQIDKFTQSGGLGSLQPNIAWDPTGNKLVIIGSDSHVRIWDITTKGLLIDSVPS